MSNDAADPYPHANSRAATMLRDALERESPAVPQRLSVLIARLPELDGEPVPSLVPDMETH